MENSVKIDKIRKDKLLLDFKEAGNRYLLYFKIDSIRIKIKITIKVYKKTSINYADILIYDVLYSTTISRNLECSSYNRLESVVYELIGRYFGIYEGSKPRDLEYFIFDNIEDRTLLESELGIDTI